MSQSRPVSRTPEWQQPSLPPTRCPHWCPPHVPHDLRQHVPFSVLPSTPVEHVGSGREVADAISASITAARMLLDFATHHSSRPSCPTRSPCDGQPPCHGSSSTAAVGGSPSRASVPTATQCCASEHHWQAGFPFGATRVRHCLQSASMWQPRDAAEIGRVGLGVGSARKVGRGVGEGEGTGVGASVGAGVGSGVGAPVGNGVGDTGVGCGVGCGVGGAGVGDGVGSSSHSSSSELSPQTPLQHRNTFSRCSQIAPLCTFAEHLGDFHQSCVVIRFLSFWQTQAGGILNFGFGVGGSEGRGVGESVKPWCFLMARARAFSRPSLKSPVSRNGAGVGCFAASAWSALVHGGSPPLSQRLSQQIYQTGLMSAAAVAPSLAPGLVTTHDSPSWSNVQRPERTEVHDFAIDARTGSGVGGMAVVVVHTTGHAPPPLAPTRASM